MNIDYDTAGRLAYYEGRKRNDHEYSPGSHAAKCFEQGWDWAWSEANVSRREPGEESDNEMARRIARDCGDWEA